MSLPVEKLDEVEMPRLDLVRFGLITFSQCVSDVNRIVTKCQDNIVQGTYLFNIMTRQEMKKLLDELDHKRVETRDKKIMEGSDDELARELEKLKKESLH